MIGAALKSSYGAAFTCEVSAIFNLSVFAILFVFNGDCRVVHEHHKFNKKLEDLKSQNPDYQTEEQQVKGDKELSFGVGSFKHNQSIKQSLGWSKPSIYRTNSHYIRPARGAFLNQDSSL